MNSIIIIGGDNRQTCLKNIFLKKGYICDHINSEEDLKALSNINKFDTVMLPLPLSKDKEHIYSENNSFLVKVKDVIGNLNQNQILVAGSIDRALSAYLTEKQIQFFDYFQREDFVIYNAYLTAQGALRLLLENTDELILSKRVLITGYGRVSKAVAEVLKKCGMDVYIAARDKIQLTEAECKGYKTLEINRLNYRMFLFDYIFNTVPFNIFTKEDIQHFKGKYFELASKPFGVKKEYFSQKPTDFISGSALPGKFLPYSSAEKIAENTLEYLLNRKGGD